jgi:hypothetical protein
MKRSPLSHARSPWQELEAYDVVSLLEGQGAKEVSVYCRNVNDGTLKVIVSVDPVGYQPGWHLSISFTDHRGRRSRYPRWDEIADARYTFVPDEVTMCMVLPPPDEYVALHDTTFHLHQHGDP